MAQQNKVVDDFEPDEDDFEEDAGDTYTGPDTFSGGFKESLRSGDALNAGLRSAGGFLKGAILDIPSSIYEGGKSLLTGDAILNSMGPLGDLISGRDSMAGVRDISSKAGSNPEAFGEMIGQMTGQPAVTAGMPSMVRGAGVPTEFAGRMMRRYQPTTGMLPRLAEGRTLRGLERMVGTGIESVGRRMQNLGKGGVTSADMPVISEGESLPKVKEQLSPSKTPKLRVKRNPDGTFTNLDTGELLDSSGSPVLSEPTRDSMIFKKNRR